MLENIRRALNKYDNRSVETMVFTKAAAVAANSGVATISMVVS